MTHVAYYEEQILRAIPRLGKEGEDADRLRQLAPLFRDNAQATMADCMAALFPDKEGKAAVDAFKAFRGRVEKAGREATPPFLLEFVVDENKRLGAARRVCRIEGPRLEPQFRSLVDDVRNLPDVSNPAYLGKPKIRLVPLHRPHDASNAHKLRRMLETDLKAHNTFEFQLVDQVDQAEVLLPLLNPAFFADEGLLDRVRGWSLEKPAVPVGLEPFDDCQSDGSFDHVQQFRLSTKSGRRLCFSECDKGQQDAFALELFRQIDAFVRDAFTRGTWRTGLDWLGAWSERRAILEGDRIVQNPATRLAMRATTAVERPVQYAPDGDAMELLQKWAVDPKAPRYLAVLGEYGIGKTTSLKRFTLALEKKRKADPKLPVPIYLDLRDGAEGTPPDASLEEILRRLLDKAPMEGPKQTPRVLLDAVQRFGAVLIFDGLDERVVHMTAAQAEGFIRELFHTLPPALLAEKEAAPEKSKGRPGKLIISCRSHYFRTLEEQRQMLTGRQRGGFRDEDCEALIILPFGVEQIRAYIDKALKLEGKQPERVDAVMRLFATIHNLSEMAPRPVLLAMLVEQIDDLERMQARTGRSLAAVDIYDRMVKRWLERDGGKHKLKPDHKIRIMEGLAAFLWEEGLKQVDIERLDSWFVLFLASNEDIRTRVAFDTLSADVLEGDLRTGTFLVRPDAEAKNFRFAHTSFQEYFLARYLARALAEGKPERWSLPMASAETLDFLGQLLRREPGEKALTTLTTILGSDDTKAAILAFNYWLLALEKDYPEPVPAFVNLAGADLEGRMIRGRSPAAPLILRDACLAGARLNRARLVDIDLTGADLAGMEARNAIFERVHASEIDAGQADWTGLQWRGGSLARAKLAEADLRCAAFDADLTDSQLPMDWEQFAAASPLRLPKVGAQGGLVWVVPTGGHTGGVLGCAFSPDGTRIVSAAADQTLKIWEASSGRLLRSLDGHTAGVRGCAFSPDGTRIVSAAEDETLKVWEASSGRLLWNLDGHKDVVRGCAFSPDGTRIVSASVDETLKVWEASSGRLLWSLDGHTVGIFGCAFSPDGTRIVSASDDRTLKVWEACSGRLLRSLDGHTAGVRGCAFSPDGTRIVSAAADRTLKVWEASSGRLLRSLDGHTAGVLR
jgi:uncharacterized protein YjbI with pentapeptide repeats